MAANYIDGSDSIATALTYQSRSSTTTPSSSSTTWVNGGVSLTILETGTYMVLYSGEITVYSGATTEGNTRLVKNGTEIPGTLKINRVRTVIGLLTSDVYVGEGGSNEIKPVDFEAGDTLEIQFRRGSGSGSVAIGPRTLNIIRVA